MDRPIVACIQHRLIVPQTADEYDAHLHRFLRTARAKGAELALFPELSGVATAIPMFGGWRNNLLKTAGQGQRSRLSLWQRAKSRLAGGAATVVRADLRKSLLQALREMPESLHDAYEAGFSALARHYEMTLVAGSLYERNPATGDIENVSLVFGPDGALLGRQAKVVLSGRDHAVSHSADGWAVIPTPAGRVGILLGNDILYPEPARILAYQGADMLLSMGAVTNPATYHKIRQAASARCQENQLYGMVSFLVGPDPFAPADAPPFVGKSAIFAPLEFTPRFTGVMVEVGSPLAEGVITAEWDYPALEELWQDSETPLRREMPLLQAGPVLASVYGRALPLAEAETLMLEAAAAAAEADEPEPAPAGPEPEAEPQRDAEDWEEEELKPPYAQIKPILPDTSLAPTLPEYDEPAEPAISPAERRAAAEALSGRMEVHANNVDAAAGEVRAAIAQASEQVRATAQEDPIQAAEEIASLVAETRQELDDTPAALPQEPPAVPEPPPPAPEPMAELDFERLPDALTGEESQAETAPAMPEKRPIFPEEAAPEEGGRGFRWPWQRR